MGSIIRTAANNVGASGVFSSSAFNNASLNSVTSLPTAVDGKMKLISSQTASGDASLSFTSGLDSTYDAYCFKFINIDPATDGAEFQFQGNAVGGSGFDETITSSHFNALHNETTDATELTYEVNHDLAQSTSFKTITRDIGNGNDECTSG